MSYLRILHNFAIRYSDAVEHSSRYALPCCTPSVLLNHDRSTLARGHHENINIKTLTRTQQDSTFDTRYVLVETFR